MNLTVRVRVILHFMVCVRANLVFCGYRVSRKGVSDGLQLFLYYI